MSHIEPFRAIFSQKDMKCRFVDQENMSSSSSTRPIWVSIQVPPAVRALPQGFFSDKMTPLDFQGL